MPKLICNNCSNELDYKDNQHLYNCPECDEGQLEKVITDEEGCNDEVQYDEAVDNNGLRVCKTCGDVFYDKESEADRPPKDVIYCCDHCKKQGDEAGRSLHDLSDGGECGCKGLTCDYPAKQLKEDTQDSRSDVAQKVDSMTMCCGERMGWRESTYDFPSSQGQYLHDKPPFDQPSMTSSFFCRKCGIEVEVTIHGTEQCENAYEFILDISDA